jgi:hypothetical protein
MDTPNPPAAPAQIQGIQIVITFDPSTGQVNLQGPLENPIMLYGVLESAKDVYRQYLAKQTADQRIIPGTFVPGFPRR